MFLAVLLAIVIVLFSNLWTDIKDTTESYKHKKTNDRYRAFWQPVLDNGEQPLTFINYRYTNGVFDDEFTTYIDGFTEEVTVPLNALFVNDVEIMSVNQVMVTVYESLTERQRDTASNEAKVMLLERALTDKSNKRRFNDEHGIVYDGVKW